MDIGKQLEKQLVINRKINKKLPPELRLPETKKEFAMRELEIITEQLQGIKDQGLKEHIENRRTKLLDFVKNI